MTLGATIIENKNSKAIHSLSTPVNDAAPSRPPKPMHVNFRMLMREAQELIENHPSTPEAWKRNINKFLWNCLEQVPHLSSWHWAVAAMKNGWCKYAPFKYFKMVLLHPKRYKSVAANPLWRLQRTYRWLLKTKGFRAARAYGKSVGLVKTTAEMAANEEGNRRKEQAGKWAGNGGPDPGGVVPSMSIEEFERERAFRKSLLGPA